MKGIDCVMEYTELASEDVLEVEKTFVKQQLIDLVRLSFAEARGEQVPAKSKVTEALEKLPLELLTESDWARLKNELRKVKQAAVAGAERDHVVSVLASQLNDNDPQEDPTVTDAELRVTATRNVDLDAFVPDAIAK